MKIQQSINELKTKLNYVIQTSNALDKNGKDMMKDLFNSLSEYTQNHIEQISDNVETQIRSKYETKTDKFNIMTILVANEKADELERKDKYYPIYNSNDSEKTKFGLFFDCSYERFMEICSGRYTASIKLQNGQVINKCECSISPDDIYAAQEWILFRAAKQYDIKRPLIFSPYSRKFATVILKDRSIRVEEIADLKRDKIGERYMSSNQYRLMWNVKYEDLIGDSIPEARTLNYVTPLFEKLMYKRTFVNTKSNMYYLFDFENTERLSVIREGGTLYVASDVNLAEIPYHRITILDPNEDIANKFENYYQPNLFSHTRLRSKADIIYTLRSFCNNPYGVTISENIKIAMQGDKILTELRRFKNYNANFSYYRDPTLERVNYDSMMRSQKLKSSLYCIVAFSGENICGDYANYVIEYLNDTYPEFNWIGVE